MIVSFVAALLIGLAAWTGSQAGLQYLFGMALPLLAVVVFIGGMIWRVLYWAKSPVPFAIPTTGGQERSLDWIKPARLDTPTTKAGVVGRMLLEVLLFRSLFRNTVTRVDPQNMRITYFSSKWLWLFALLFHYCFLVTFIRHFRFFLEPVPICLEWVEFFDGILQVGAPTLFISNVLIVCALAFLFLRRLVNPKLRYISMANDYFPLFIIIGLVSTGICMRYFDKIDVAQAKVFIMGLAPECRRAEPALLHPSDLPERAAHHLPLQQACAYGRRIPLAHAQPALQHPSGASRQSLEQAHRLPHLRRI